MNIEMTGGRCDVHPLNAVPCEQCADGIKGLCPICHRSVSANSDGRVRKHSCVPLVLSHRTIMLRSGGTVSLVLSGAFDPLKATLTDLELLAWLAREIDAYEND